MEKAVWLSYDLGVRGDYTSLYEWLDNHDAKECGNSIAFFKYEVGSREILKNIIKKDISKSVTLEKRDRIYIMYLDSKKKMKGSFIFGRRKSSPWKGYGSKKVEIDE